MREQLYINGQNALHTWGVELEKGGVNLLLTPPPMKPYVENKSTAEHGKTVYPVNPRIDERDIQLPIILTARTPAEFASRYVAFLSVLQSGLFTMRIVYGSFDITYKFTYQSCQQFSEMNQRLGKYVLRLNEPNPADRE